MRVLFLATVAGLLVLGMNQAAKACDPAFESCGRAVVVFPAYTLEGLRLGAIGDRIQGRPVLETSRSTGRPLTVLYNNPTSRPRSVDPQLFLMPLPRVGSSHTRAVYPVGY